MAHELMPSSEESDQWEVQRRLTGELMDSQKAHAPDDKIAQKADQINHHVAGLVESGEIDPGDAWALSAGNNPYLEEFDSESIPD